MEKLTNRNLAKTKTKNSTKLATSLSLAILLTFTWCDDDMKSSKNQQVSRATSEEEQKEIQEKLDDLLDKDKEWDTTDGESVEYTGDLEDIISDLLIDDKESGDKQEIKQNEWKQKVDKKEDSREIDIPEIINSLLGDEEEGQQDTNTRSEDISEIVENLKEKRKDKN